MKKRYSIIFTITAAAVLVSSIAYASKKKLRPASEPRLPDMSEVDLSAHLMEQSGNRKSNGLKDASVKKRGDEELNDLTMAYKPNSPDTKWTEDLQTK